MVSTGMMALAFDVLKPPCSGGPKCHVWQASIDFPCFLEGTHPQTFKFYNFLRVPVRNGRRVPGNRDNGNLYQLVDLLGVVHVLGQLLDGVECFLSDIVTFKSQVTSDCETDHQVLDWVPRHHYLRLAISELKDAEIKRAFSLKS